MSLDRIRIKTHRSEFPYTYIDLFVYRKDDRGYIYVANDVELMEIKPGEVASPTMKLDRDAAQELMDNLWECGIRPTEGSGSAGSLAATERHLSDMRKLVSKKIGVDL